MNPMLKVLFDLIVKFSGPFKGNRTAIGLAGAIAVAIYAAAGGDYSLFAAMAAVVFAIVGLKPEDPPAPPAEHPDVLQFPQS